MTSKNSFTYKAFAKPLQTFGVILLITVLGVNPVLSQASKTSQNTAALGPGEYTEFSPGGDIRRFSGETLMFNIGFLIFPRAATAQVRFFEKNGSFQSELIAETRGVVGFFTAYRKHVYRSKFEVVDNGQRLRSKVFEREVIIGEDVERTVHFLDYENHIHHWFLYKNDVIQENKREPIPKGVFFDDVLAAFYNFRNGVYGELSKGKEFKIDTIPDKSMKDISVAIQKNEQQKELNSLVQREDADDLLALKVVVPKDVFKTKTGQLLFWSSKHFIPLETTVKDYILLGDLHAQFEKRIYDNPKYASVAKRN